MPNSFMNFLTGSVPSVSIEIPTTTSPLAAYFFWSATYPGISVRQGGHQVAQKSRITTFPLNWSEVTVVPSTPFSFQAGAGRGRAGAAPRAARGESARTSAAATLENPDFIGS